MRRTYLLCCLVFGIAFSAKSQFNTEFGVNLGASGYLGDIGGQLQNARPWIEDMKLQETRGAFGAYFRQKLNKNFFFESQFNYVRLSGADSLSTNIGRVGRNLYFRDNIFSLSAMIDWVFYQVTDIGGYYNYKTSFTAYLTGGVSVFHYDPQAMYQGNWVDLEPLHTEGVSYSLWAPGVPMGIGFFYTINRQYRIGWNLIWTETFTDYLDDVSGKYVPQEANSEAAYLANRTVLPGTSTPAGTMTEAWASNYAPGQKRGNPNNNDSYITTQLSFGYVLKAKSHTSQKRSLFNYRSRSSF